MGAIFSPEKKWPRQGEDSKLTLLDGGHSHKKRERDEGQGEKKSQFLSLFLSKLKRYRLIQVAVVVVVVLVVVVYGGDHEMTCPIFVKHHFFSETYLYIFRISMTWRVQNRCQKVHLFYQVSLGVNHNLVIMPIYIKNPFY